MKSKYYSLRSAGLLLLFLAFWGTSNAQVNPARATNDELRRLFGGLIHTQEYLYDMSVHVTDENLFAHFNTNDTIDSDTWYRVYSECFYMAYDTTVLQYDETIYDQAANLGIDTIPMGIMDFEFHKLKPNALTTGNYFTFDVINNTIQDIPNRPDEPYDDKNIFSAAPLFASSLTNEITFLISPAFIYKDIVNSIYYAGLPYELYVDFGDGTGKHFFDPNIPTYYNARYPSGSQYAYIETTIEIDGQVRKLSRSVLQLGKNSQAFSRPDNSYSPPGSNITVGVFNHCANSGDTKIVIYLAGFNALDFIPKYRRTAGAVYDGMIKDPKISQLRNFGYEFHIVVWNDSRQDLRTNATSVVVLLDYLKQNYGTQHQFIIIGESMGGLIARYALCYMESPAYQDTLIWSTGFARDYMHNTRELITFDTPHQGANIPLAIQFFYDDALQGFGFLAPTSARYNMQKYNLFLDGTAAKQMLIYHIDTQSGTSFSSHQEKIDFFNDLNALGGYPRYSKLVALSNGALDGTPQFRFYNFTPRTPNDRFIDAGINLYMRVLWFTVPLFDGNLKLLSNPNGSGLVYEQSTGYYSYSIRLRLFGVRLRQTFNTLTSRSESADVLPLCTSPGGYESAGTEAVIGQSTSATSWQLSQIPLFNLFGYKSGSDGNGCWNFSAHIGINGFLSANANIWACSDGFNFCFVPIQSALDYGVLGVSPTLFHDIASDPVVAKFSYTPFDVISGISNQDYNPMLPNMPHMYIKYENNERNFMSTFNSYAACGGSQFGHWINREIGDDVLYLDNLEVNWSSTYESYDYLYVNTVSNPAYDFGGGGNLNGIYSRSNPFIHTGAGVFSNFLCDATTILPWQHYSVSGIPSTEYSVSQTNGFNCCNGYRLMPTAETSDEQNGQFALFPNPLTGDATLSIELNLTSTGPVDLELYDYSGKKIMDTQLNPQATEGKQLFSVNFSDQQLTTGVYLVRVTAGNEVYTRKLIVQ